MRVLVITKRQYMSHDLINDLFGRNYHIPLGLVARGCEVRVVAGDYVGGESESVIEGDVRLESVPFGVTSMLGFWMRVRHVVRDWHPNVVIANGDIHFGVIGWFAARIGGTRFIYDLYDNYLAFDAARFPGMPAVHRWLIRRSDRVLAISQPLADDVTGVGARAVSVVGNGVDVEVFYPRPRSEGRSRVGLADDAQIVGYVGGITDTRGVAELIVAIASLRQTEPRLQLVLVGPNLSNLDLDEPWILHVPPVAQAEVPYFISAFDVAVLPYLDDEWGRFTHPQKLGEYLACAVPVVATTVPGYASIEGLDAIQWAIPGDAVDLARAIRLQLTMPTVGSMPVNMSWLSVIDDAERAVVATLGGPIQYEDHNKP